jgi:hypothetical protein
MTAAADVTLTIRQVAALRALCLRLPHMPTPAERAQLDRFGVLATDPGAATTADIESLAAGWRRWWLGDDANAIQAMAEKLPPGLVNEDRRLASYAVAARLRTPRARLPWPASSDGS